MKFVRLLIIGLVVVIVSFAQAEDILVMGLFKDMAILTIDGKKRKLRVGQTSPEGVKLISANSEEAVLEIQGKHETYQLGSQISTRFIQDKKAIAQIWPTQGMYLTSGSINGQPVDFLIDTGASWVAMNSHHARRLGIDYRYLGIQSWAGTANGRARVYIVKLKKVTVGEIELHNVDGAVMDGGSPTTILLGNSFLNRLEMSRKGEMLMLKKNF